MSRSVDWSTVGLAAIATVGVGAFFALRKSSRSFQVAAVLPRNKNDVFEFHVDPVSFYRVLELKTRGDKGYRVVSVHESPDRSTVSYALEHTTKFGVIKSTPLRFDVVRFGAEPSFKEVFTALGTTFTFHWQFSERAPESTAIALRIDLAGPAACVSFFSRVCTEFELRFETTLAHIDALIPAKKAQA